MPRLLVICLLLACGAAHAETYRWTDGKGHTVFSDTPPPGNAQKVAKTGTASEPGDSTPLATRKAAENFPVTLYTSADCVAECKQARDLLNTRGIPFTETMVKNQEEADALKKISGDAFVPTLKVGKETSRGYSPAAYNNLLDLAGYPKSAPPGSKPSGGLSK